jgi:hypothetical protein
MHTELIWLILSSVLLYLILVTYVNMRFNYWDYYY